MITLITCTPYGINTHRLVIQADRTEYVKEVKDSIKPKFTFKLSEGTIIRMSGIILGLIFLYLAIRLLKRKQKNKVITKDSVIVKEKNSNVIKKTTPKKKNNNHKKKKRKQRKKRGNISVKKQKK